MDLSGMNYVRVSRQARTATCGGGALLRDFDLATARSGLGTTLGIVSSTGVAGLTLGGGLGWLMGRLGLACDNLISTRFVLTNGTVVVGGEADGQDADLAWCMRGAGSSMGIATELTFNLHPVRWVVAGSIAFPIGRAAETSKRLDALLRHGPDSLTVSPSFVNRKGEEVFILDICLYEGKKADQGSQYLSSIASFPYATRHTLRKRRYVDWQHALDDGSRSGLRSYWKTVDVESLDDCADIVAGAFAACPSRDTIVSFDHIHGVASRIPTRPSCLAERYSRLAVLINSNWRYTAGDRSNLDWADELWHALTASRPAHSAYGNYLPDSSRRRDQRVYGTHWTNVRRMRQRYDPVGALSYESEEAGEVTISE
ncbi:FAD-binding oxidoreductase [Jatrophihabitans sp.]|uniref:FAD-binding oxidoreductase n=1 Tax=Jatrophihabitans sp. TaxID=1932789 RepID=UPI0038CD7BAD